jgi:short-subunit dehydrogenase
MPLPPAGPDRTCLVTGASSGIGADIARELAARGLGVTLVARREDRLRDLAAELASRHGVRAEVLAADLADAESRAGIEPELSRRGLTVDILVNNAGATTMGAVARGDREAELRIVRVDVEAVVDLCTTFVAGMVGRGRGAILNTASTAAYQPLPGQASYGGSKAFVLSYSQALAAELKGTGVTVTCLCPGPVETGFADAAGLSDEDAAQALPKIMWVSKEAVAAAAVAGLEKGKGVVIPGPANRVGAMFAQHVPRRVLLPILARQHPALKTPAEWRPPSIGEQNRR